MQKKKKFWQMLMLSLAGAGLMTASLAGTQAAASPLDGYDRAKTADTNYRALHGSQAFPLEETDPEYAAMMKKYIYGDIAQQVRITPVERALVTIAVLTTNQNERLTANAVEEALAAGATPLEIREAVYHIAPYVGFAKTTTGVEIMDEVFVRHGIKLPLAPQGTTTDADRFEKGLAYQVGAFGDRIVQMREGTPEEQMHLQDDLSAFCFGDVYTRGTHDRKMRGMLTMAAIGTLGIEAQFRSHINGTLAAGASTEEIIGVITTMNPYVGFPRTLWMLKIANEVFDARNAAAQ